MNRTVGWILAALALAAGWRLYGWQGVVMAVTVLVFWLLLQFNRSLRVMQNAGRSPIGRVPSAVMLHSKLKPGMTLMDIVQISKALGRQVTEEPQTWAWSDESGATITVTMKHARLESWHLTRPETSPEPEDSGTGPASP